MRLSFPARSSKARATAVMASTPPRRSYREPSTVPTSCALVTNGPTALPAPRILKPFSPGQVNLYLLLTDKTAGPRRRVGHGSSEPAFEAENNHVSPQENMRLRRAWMTRGTAVVTGVQGRPIPAWLRTAAGRVQSASGPTPETPPARGTRQPHPAGAVNRR